MRSRVSLVRSVAAGILLGGLAAAAACSRSQELVDDPKRNDTVTPRPACDGGVPEVPDSGIASAELTECEDRPMGDCQGSNDFPCDFDSWFQAVARECQTSTECRANGCVEARVGSDGCVTSLHMAEPDDAFVACLVETLGAYRCPCGVTSARRFLGLANDGCVISCMGGEHLCPGGYVCVNGLYCEPIGAGGGGG